MPLGIDNRCVRSVVNDLLRDKCFLLTIGEIMTKNRDLLGQPVQLKCSCCGDTTAGRQWWNRDKGYGLCDHCIPFASNRMSDIEFAQCYGIKGNHYGLEPEKELAPA